MRRHGAILGASLAAVAAFLSGCVESWEQNGPTSLPGGTGITASQELAEGPGAVSSITPLPTRNRQGAVPPYAARGEAAAYEFSVGYRVGAGDRLAIRVAGEDDLTGEFLVDPSGNVSLPYVQNLPVAGLTSAQIGTHIAARLRQGFLRDPQVSVQISTLRPFYILGEVNGAGSFPYQGGMTVQNAIAIAGGYSARANKNEVLLTRRNIKGTETFRVPVTTQVYPGDVIYIRERWF
jgi:polysaccharide biosynthesis/export protein